MEQDLDDLLGNANDTVEGLIALDASRRPRISTPLSQNDVEQIVLYADLMKFYCREMSIPCDLDVPDPEDDVSQEAAKLLYRRTTAFVERQRLGRAIQRRFKAADTNSVTLDTHWKRRIHSYIGQIRGVVEAAPHISLERREKILSCLGALAKAVDMDRTAIQRFTDALVQLCAGVGEGARELEPAIKAFERIVGAITRLGDAPPVLQLPPPETLNLPPADTPPSDSEQTTDA